jgi:HlyD family secretion protein
VALRFTLFRDDPVPVTVSRVARGRVEETVTNSKAGSVRSRHRASLSPDIGGRVAAVDTAKGERVRAGQVLLRLEDADYRAQVVFQERSLDAARATESEACRAAEQARRDADRYTRLSTEEIVSREILDQVESRRDMARSACDAAKARTSQTASSLRIARVTLRKTVLTAPFDGVVADLSTEVGEWITPSPPGVPIPPVIEVIDPRAIYVSAPLDEVDVAKVRSGLPARVTMDAYPGRSFPGRVSRVAAFVTDVQEQSRTFEIEVELDDAPFSRTLVPARPPTSRSSSTRAKTLCACRASPSWRGPGFSSWPTGASLRLR